VIIEHLARLLQRPPQAGSRMPRHGPGSRPPHRLRTVGNSKLSTIHVDD
jgi:hypothetical protein